MKSLHNAILLLDIIVTHTYFRSAGWIVNFHETLKYNSKRIFVDDDFSLSNLSGRLDNQF